MAKADEQQRVAEALDLVRLGGYGERRTWEMSGGQQQRVALARALVNHPTVLLLDEPLGALDLKLRKEMQLELKALQREVGITFVYVTHDQEEALTMSDVIVVMRDGRIQQQGEPADSTNGPSTGSSPASSALSNFLPRIGAVDRHRDRGHVGVHTDLGLDLRGRITDQTGAPASAVTRSTIAIRPERLRGVVAARRMRRGPGRQPCQGRIHQGTYLGDQTEFRSTPIGGRSHRSPPERHGRQKQAGPGPGDPVIVTWQEEANLVLALTRFGSARGSGRRRNSTWQSDDLDEVTATDVTEQA